MPFLEGIVGHKPARRTELNRALWEYVKSHSTKDHTHPLGRTTNDPTLALLLGKHFQTTDVDGRGELVRGVFSILLSHVHDLRGPLCVTLSLPGYRKSSGGLERPQDEIDFLRYHIVSEDDSEATGLSSDEWHESIS